MEAVVEEEEEEVADHREVAEGEALCCVITTGEEGAPLVCAVPTRTLPVRNF